jgi:hypothetical protein
LLLLAHFSIRTTAEIYADMNRQPDLRLPFADHADGSGVTRGPAKLLL